MLGFCYVLNFAWVNHFIDEFLVSSKSILILVKTHSIEEILTTFSFLDLKA